MKQKQISFRIAYNNGVKSHRCKVFFNGSWRVTKSITCHVPTRSCINTEPAFTMDGLATKIVVTSDEIIIA